MLEEARGGGYWPESAMKAVGDSEVWRGNLCSPVAPVGCGLGKKEEGSLALITVWSRRGINAAFRRIQAKN